MAKEGNLARLPCPFSKKPFGGGVGSRVRFPARPLLARMWARYLSVDRTKAKMAGDGHPKVVVFLHLLRIPPCHARCEHPATPDGSIWHPFTAKTEKPLLGLLFFLLLCSLNAPLSERKKRRRGGQETKTNPNKSDGYPAKRRLSRPAGRSPMIRPGRLVPLHMQRNAGRPPLQVPQVHRTRQGWPSVVM